MKKKPLLSFAILFFFLNHSIESSFLNLELIFEHRNYAPSFFLFLPVAALFKKTTDHYYQNKKSMYLIMVSFMTLLLIGLGTGTYIRNFAWHSEKTLWEDALEKSPKSGRSMHNLAWGYYEPNKEYDKALEFYQRALDSHKHNDKSRPWAMNNIANVYYIKGNYQKALEWWENAVKISPEFDLLKYRLALAASKAGKFETALTNIDLFIPRWPEDLQAFNLKGLLLLRKGKPKEAISYFMKCLDLNPEDKTMHLNTGIVYYFLNDFKRAEFFLKSSLKPASKPTSKKDASDFLSLLWLIETKLKTGDKEGASPYIEKLIKETPLNVLVEKIKNLYEKNLVTPVPKDFAAQALSHKLSETSLGLFEIIN